MEAMREGVARFDIDEFYFLARTAWSRTSAISTASTGCSAVLQGARDPDRPDDRAARGVAAKLAERYLTTGEKAGRGARRLGQADGDAAPAARRAEGAASGRQ